MVMKVLAALITVLFSVHYMFLDGVSGLIFAPVFGDTTTYAPRYSDSGFRRVRKGMSEQQIQDLIGSPLGETWGYVPLHERKPYDSSDPCAWVHIRDGRVEEYVDPRCTKQGVRPFMPVPELAKLLGPTTFVKWRYSESRVNSSYRIRVVDFSNGRVVEKVSEFYVD